jgi:two-component system CheB/CheR fusion protein
MGNSDEAANHTGGPSGEADTVAGPADGMQAAIGRNHATFPIVGLGASAGGLKAFAEFFAGMPAVGDPGMAFVLVQHLAPDHKSSLVELIRRYTRMPVCEVEDGMEVQRNCVYIIPPNRDLAFLNGTLQLLEPVAARGHRLPIDFFFRSLAQDLRERAIGIVLSGTGSDGMLGVRAIKGEGGMVMAQEPVSAEYDGMPRSAITTGQVDYVMPPAEMPVQLVAYVAQLFGRPVKTASYPNSGDENALKKIIILLRSQAGHDFSQYKVSTIHRRIERRMAFLRIETKEDYVKHLQQMPDETDALFRDLLIGVTSFFRDPDAFQALEQQIIPRILANKPAGAVIRLWSVGCSTGEEAYSLAMLLQEGMAARQQQYPVQIFATDIDSQAIATARTGRYPASIAADLSRERLGRFFTADPDGSTYRVSAALRDMLVFSEQDLVQHPPFSRLDLISCRNIMIYMGLELQKKLIPMFHHALNPDGMLFLGTSETVGDFTNLFTPLDRKAKLYLRTSLSTNAQTAARAWLAPRLTPQDLGLPQPVGVVASPGRSPLRDLTEQELLLQVVPAAVLVTGQGDILYQHGRTGMYLEPAPGEAKVNNILSMAREGLRCDLVLALHKAAKSDAPVRYPGLRVKTNGHYTLVDLCVRPVASAPGTTREPPLFLVILQEAPGEAKPGPAAGVDANAGEAPEAQADLVALRQELRVKEESLRIVNEELESFNEELRSANEEMQSLNEELQSSNEELETSKEEMQSVNEELTTLTGELQSKVTDLSRANNDLNNLLAGTGIATIFLDHKLCIVRFTPMAARMVNLIQSDVGRPVAHLTSCLAGYDSLTTDAQAVLDTLIPKEISVATATGSWYALRIQPYRTLDNVIEGVVLTFVDVTEMKRMQEALREANALQHLAAIARDAQDAMVVQGLDGRIRLWNPAAVRQYGWSEAEAMAMPDRERIPPELREAAAAKVLALNRGEALEPYRTSRIAKDGSIKEVSMTWTALVDEAGSRYALATTECLLATQSRDGA